MKQNKRKILSLLLVFSMIIGNLTGIQVKAADVVLYGVESQTKTITNEGGMVVVNVKGENLPDTMYYRVRTKGAEMTSPTNVIVEPTTVQMVNNQLNIRIPESNLMEIGGKVYINVNSENNFSNAKTVTLDVVKGTGSVEVDKTALNAKIEEAKKLVESEWSSDSWKAFETARSQAQMISAKNDATESEVKEALNALTKAMDELQPNGGSDVPDASKIQAKVVDQNGNPMKDITVDIIDLDLGSPTERSLKSDAEGKVEGQVKDYIDINATYQLKVNSEFSCKPADGYEFAFKDGKIEAINGKPFTGKEDVTFTLYTGGSTDPEKPDPEADEKTLVIHVKDKAGKPVSGCGMAIVDDMYPNNEGRVKTSDMNGVIKFKIGEGSTDEYTESGVIRLPRSSEYTTVTDNISFTCQSKVFKTVNGKAYDGKTAFDFVVDKEEDPNAPAEITGFIPMNKTDLPASGGERKVSFLTIGKHLLGKIDMEITRDGKVEELPHLVTAETNERYDFDVTFPENDTEEAREYSIRVFSKENPNVSMTKTVTVQAAEKQPEGPDGPDGPEEPDDTTEGTVKSVTVNPNHVPSEGGTVELKVTGENLTASNWGIDYKCNIAGMNMAAPKPGTITVKEMTAEGAVLQISKNPMSNQLEYVITVGGKKNGKVQNQAEVIVGQDEKERTLPYPVTPKLVELADSNTIYITMNEEVVFASDDVENLKQYFYIVDKTKRINVTEQDTISIEGNRITVKLKEALPELSSQADFYLDEGGLRLAKPDNGVSLLQGTKWVIDSKPRITKIAYDKDVLDYKGGKVTVRLKGVRLDEVEKSQLDANVTGMGFELSNPIAVNIEAGAEPVLTFDLPQNDTDKTMSYLLKVYMNDTQVVEGISGNKAERAIVSVLPKGVAEDAMTLSHMTITGNNKIEENAAGTEITVNVSDSLGELKTELKLSGTNLDSSKTKVRAIDENGVIFPVYDIPE